MSNYIIEFFERWGLLGRKYYFRIKEENGQTVAQSQGYRHREDSIRTGLRLRARLFDAKVLHEEDGA